MLLPFPSPRCFDSLLVLPTEMSLVEPAWLLESFLGPETLTRSRSQSEARSQTQPLFVFCFKTLDWSCETAPSSAQAGITSKKTPLIHR